MIHFETFWVALEKLPKRRSWDALSESLHVPRPGDHRNHGPMRPMRYVIAMVYPYYSNVLGMFGGYLGDVWGMVGGIFGGCFGRVRGMCEGCLGGVSGDVSGMLRGCFGDVQGDFVFLFFILVGRLRTSCPKRLFGNQDLAFIGTTAPGLHLVQFEKLREPSESDSFFEFSMSCFLFNFLAFCFIVCFVCFFLFAVDLLVIPITLIRACGAHGILYGEGAPGP